MPEGRKFKKFSRNEVNKQLGDINDKLDAILDALLILVDIMAVEVPSEPVVEKAPEKQAGTLRKKSKA